MSWLGFRGLIRNFSRIFVSVYKNRKGGNLQPDIVYKPARVSTFFCAYEYCFYFVFVAFRQARHALFSLFAV